MLTNTAHAQSHAPRRWVVLSIPKRARIVYILYKTRSSRVLGTDQFYCTTLSTLLVLDTSIQIKVIPRIQNYQFPKRIEIIAENTSSKQVSLKNISIL